jgi:hypothetical protein
MRLSGKKSYTKYKWIVFVLSKNNFTNYTAGAHKNILRRTTMALAANHRGTWVQVSAADALQSRCIKALSAGIEGRTGSKVAVLNRHKCIRTGIQGGTALALVDIYMTMLRAERKPMEHCCARSKAVVECG